ncbi:MAG: hypothetical protein JWQ81_127 [Amycolatopsis sp.]|jgi:hypothetical protein|nr:hypothetical protein [Amycolatopsis sp.]MCU1679388.1 hypothetical protein [Amycolatopsis sp.]
MKFGVTTLVVDGSIRPDVLGRGQEAASLDAFSNGRFHELAKLVEQYH